MSAQLWHEIRAAARFTGRPGRDGSITAGLYIPVAKVRELDARYPLSRHLDAISGAIPCAPDTGAIAPETGATEGTTP